VERAAHENTCFKYIPDQFVRSCAQTHGGVQVQILHVKDTINYAQIWRVHVYLKYMHFRNAKIYVGNVSEIVMVQTTLILIHC
jgi:hypothetical protein